jgi:hypothetical protein
MCPPTLTLELASSRIMYSHITSILTGQSWEGKRIGHQWARKEHEKKEWQCSNWFGAHATREKGWKGEETTGCSRGGCGGGGVRLVVLL